MPNPRNRIKQTGDTHLPDVGDEGGPDEEVQPDEPAEAASPGTENVAAETAPTAAAAGSYLDAAREQVRQRPVVALAGAFALGYLLARI